MSVAKNYIYNVTYQILLIILPIITVPYITRVLGSYGIGVNTVTNTTIQFFILFGSLGVSLYGSRTIAYVRDDRKNLSRQFWSIFILKVFTTLCSYSVFAIYLCLIHSQYKFYLMLQSISIVAVAVDVSWLLAGMEQFKKTAVRNIIVKLTSVILIISLVKSQKDLWLYILIMTLSNFIGQVSLWAYVPQIVDKCKISFNDIKSHLAPSLKLFVPQVAVQIYSLFDKTFVGYMVSKPEAGIYDMGERIIYLSITIVSAMATVMLPRVTNTIANGDIKGVKNYIIKSFNFASYIAFPMCFGMIGISKGFAVWFMGREFLRSGYVMAIESPMIIFIAWNSVTGTQLLLPLGKTNEYTMSVILGAAVDIAGNLILVKSLYSYGASISSVLAEFTVAAIQMYLLRHMLPFKEMFKDTWKYLAGSIAMYAVIVYLNFSMRYCFLATITEVAAGIVIYAAVQFVLKTKFQRYVIRALGKKLYKAD